MIEGTVKEEREVPDVVQQQDYVFQALNHELTDAELGSL